MLKKSPFKQIHLVVYISLSLSLLISSIVFVQGELRRIDLIREQVGHQISNEISSSMKEYEQLLTSLSLQISQHTTLSQTRFNTLTRPLITTPSLQIKNVFFAHLQANEVSSANTSDRPISITHSYPNDGLIGGNLLEMDATEPALSSKLQQNPMTSLLLVTQADGQAMLIKGGGALPTLSDTDMLAPINIVALKMNLAGLVNDIEKITNKEIHIRLLDLTNSSEKADTEIIYQSENAHRKAWQGSGVTQLQLDIYDKQWGLEIAFERSVIQLFDWSSVSLPIFILLLVGVYLYRSTASYNKILDENNQQIKIDPLTNLHSRYCIYDKLTESITHAKKGNSQLMVICMDLDHFKTINDAFNHDVGDKMLAKVAQRLVSVLPDETVIGRLGGDEFLAFLELNTSTTQDNMKSLCEEVISQVSQSYFIDKRMLTVGCSIGVALYPDYGDDAVTLVKNADIAMYKAKSLGRATYHFYDGSIGRQLARNAEIENRLRHAMQYNQLQMYFQPKVNLVTLECVGLEALLRWEDEELGVVSPAEFIPIAEQSGIILPLGEWVIEQTCRQIAEWREQGDSVIPPIAINCSAAQLRRQDFISRFLNHLYEFNVSPAQIELEVTESILIEDPEHCASVLRQISSMGMKITIDDFGTGYSSLSYLRNLPFDCIKIDQAFIHNIMEDESNAALTNAIIKMGQGLKLQIVAEGITTHEQLTYLRSLGCDIGQGYLFGEAFHADQLPYNAKNIEESMSAEGK